MSHKEHLTSGSEEKEMKIVASEVRRKSVSQAAYDKHMKVYQSALKQLYCVCTVSVFFIVA